MRANRATKSPAGETVETSAKSGSSELPRPRSCAYVQHMFAWCTKSTTGCRQNQLTQAGQRGREGKCSCCRRTPRTRRPLSVKLKILLKACRPGHNKASSRRHPRQGTHSTPKRPRPEKAPVSSHGPHAARWHPLHTEAPTSCKRRQRCSGLDGHASSTHMPPPRSDRRLESFTPCLQFQVDVQSTKIFQGGPI